MCIDIFAPGKCIDIDFLLEQIWFASDPVEHNRLDITEVYDLLIHNPHGNEPVEDILVLSPRNFTKGRDSSREIQVQASIVGSEATRKSRYNWIFSEEAIVDEKGLQVSRIYPSGNSGFTTRACGKPLVPEKIDFPPSLSDRALDTLSEIGSTCVHLRFKPLFGGETGWLRLIMKPSS